MSQSKEFYRRDIDGLRAIAILSVVGYHAGLAGVPGGFVGVDVFFVLSGYLITSILVAEASKTATISLRSFYARRIRRLFPALFLVVCVTCFLGFFVLLPVFDQQQDLGRSGIATALYVSNFYFWLNAPGYFDPSSDLKPFLHTWSLSVEEQFYIAWPLMVIATVWLARRWRWDFERALLILTIIVLFTSLAWCIRMTAVDPTAAFYLLPSRAWELGTGAALALWLPKVTRKGTVLGGCCSLIGVLAIFFAVTTFDADMAFPGYLAVLPVVGAALVVVGGHLAPLNPVQLVLSTRPMVFLGLLSYSWYLWHWPLLALTRVYFLEEPNLGRDLVVVVFSLLLAYASYRFVENPIRFGRPGPFRRPDTTLAAGLLITMAMCIPAGAVGAWAKFIGSDRAQFQALVAAKNDRPPLRTKCHQSPPFSSLPAVASCLTGEGGQAPAFVLWGDSHADHLSPLIQEFTKSPPFTPVLVRSFSGCPSLVNFDVKDSRQENACRLFNSAVLAEITELAGNGLQGVVLSSRWLAVFGAPSFQSITDPPAAGAPSERASERIALFTSTVQQLTDLGLKVLIVAPMPEMRFDIPNCLARRSPVQCGVARDLVNAQRHEVMQLLLALSSRWPNVRIFDPIDQLCDLENCFAERGAQILFADDDHLTASASRLLLPAATELLHWVSE